MRLILERDDGSASGDDDFFSVARTMPFVAWVRQYDGWAAAKGPHGGVRLTFDTESRHTLVDGIQGILCETKHRSARPSRAGEAGASDGVVTTTTRWRRRTNLHQLSAVGEVSYRIVELPVHGNVSLPGGEGGQREGVSVCHGCYWSRTPGERILRCGSARRGVSMRRGLTFSSPSSSLFGRKVVVGIGWKARL